MEVLGGDKSDIVTGRAASEAEVKAAKLSDYRVLYFATHGLLAGEVEDLAKVKAEPALLFAVPEKPTPEDDGLLTASEVAQLKLNADWEVLSACNTAAGGKPGAAALSGIARVFFYAGARSLLVPYWPVDNKATKELMVRLFETVKTNPGKRAAEAQQKAATACAPASPPLRAGPVSPSASSCCKQATRVCPYCVAISAGAPYSPKMQL